MKHCLKKIAVVNLLSCERIDPEHAYLTLVVPSMVFVKPTLDWAKQQPGVASARVEITVEAIDLWDNASELFSKPLARPLSA